MCNKKVAIAVPVIDRNGSYISIVEILITTYTIFFFVDGNFLISLTIGNI